MTTIIHINPNPEMQMQVRQGLAHTYQLVSVNDAPTAIQYAAMIHPIMILIDADVPGLSELTLRLKMFMPETPILMFADQSTVVTGGDDVLYRPFSNYELQHAVQQLLKKYASPLPTDHALEHQITSLSEANQRLASLNTISALIGTSLDMVHLTDEILGQLQKIIDFDSATLFLLKGNVLEAAASRGFSEFGQGMNTFLETEYNSAWRVVKNKLPLVINDVTESRYWENRPELSRVRSWLGVPLINKDRVVGVLTLDNNESGAFSESDARHVFTLAFQIATTVENTQLFEALESQATRLKLINEVSQELTTILDLGSLYNTLARALVERLNYDRAAIFATSPEAEFLVLQACYQDQDIYNETVTLDNYRVPLAGDNGVIGEAIRTGRPVLINNLNDSTYSMPGMPVRSTLAVAVFVDNQVEAVINVDSPLANCFNDHDLWTLGSLAIHTATIIENARLYHDIDSYSAQLQRAVTARSQRLAAIKNISQVISQGVSVEELSDVVGERVSQIFADSTEDSVQVATVLFVAGRLRTKVIYDADCLMADNAFISATYQYDSKSIVGQVMTGSGPRILHNVKPGTIYSRRKAAIGHDTQNSLMLAPLITAGKTIGVIVVHTPQLNAFDEGDLEILETLAFQVASAIETSRLLRKTREMAVVNERTRLARDMHDGVAQNLAYLLLQVDRSLNLVEPDSKLEQQLENVANLLKQNIDELRRNIFDLRPVDLEEQSLFNVLEKFVSEFGQRWKLKTRCKINASLDTAPPEIEQVVYRILQEALSNARKHAHCQHIEVYLVIDPDVNQLVLTVADDGEGFDLGQLQQSVHRGLGLISMRERTESVDGALTIESLPGQGTTVKVVLPLE
jgi:signal transduction histidine kinase